MESETLSLCELLRSEAVAKQQEDVPQCTENGGFRYVSVACGFYPSAAQVLPGSILFCHVPPGYVRFHQVLSGLFLPSSFSISGVLVLVDSGSLPAQRNTFPKNCVCVCVDLCSAVGGLDRSVGVLMQEVRRSLGLEPTPLLLNVRDTTHTDDVTGHMVHF